MVMIDSEEAYPYHRVSRDKMVYPGLIFSGTVAPMTLRRLTPIYELGKREPIGYDGVYGHEYISKVCRFCGSNIHMTDGRTNCPNCAGVIG